MDTRRYRHGGRCQCRTRDSEHVLDVYNWADFMDPSVLSAFEQEYGIMVNYDVYDSNEQLETKLLVGHSNYDVVVPGGAFFERQIKAGFYLKLDPRQLPNLENVDPEAIRGLAAYDPGDQYGVNYMWLSTSGIGYDVAKIKAPMPDAPLDSWRLLYDPAVLAKFKDCGISGARCTSRRAEHCAGVRTSQAHVPAQQLQECFERVVRAAGHEQLYRRLEPNPCACAARNSHSTGASTPTRRLPGLGA